MNIEKGSIMDVILIKSIENKFAAPILQEQILKIQVNSLLLLLKNIQMEITVMCLLLTVRPGKVQV